MPRLSIPVCALLQGTFAEILRGAEKLSGEPSCCAVKLKVGRQPNVEEDARLVRQVRSSLASHQRLRLDANRAWDFATARQFARGIAGCDIEYLEEPLQDPHQLETLYSATGLPYALDETLSEGMSLGGFPQVAALIIKPTLLGGQSRVEALKSLGTPLVFSACYESGVGIARVAELAQLYSPTIPAGLDTYSWLAEDVLRQRWSMRDWQLTIDADMAVDTGKLEEVRT